MGVLNGAAIVGVVLVAHRRGGTELAALAGLVMALLIRSLGVSLLVDIWNPWAAFLPFVLFVMLAWAVLCRDWAMLPIAVFVGSCVVQIHAGYLPLVAPLLAFVAAFAVVDFVRRHRAASGDVRDHGKCWLIAAGAVAIAVWMPALVQQVTTSNGNLAALFHYVRDPRQATAGWTLAYGVLGAELRPVGAWVTGNDNDGIGFTAVSDVWPAVVVVALLVCTGLLAWWRGRRDAARLSAVAAVSVVLAVIATSKLTGDVAFYLTRWWWAVAAIANLAVVWALISVSSIAGGCAMS
jgi:hypothetical protein